MVYRETKTFFPFAALLIRVWCFSFLTQAAANRPWSLQDEVPEICLQAIRSKMGESRPQTQGGPGEHSAPRTAELAAETITSSLGGSQRDQGLMLGTVVETPLEMCDPISECVGSSHGSEPNRSFLRMHTWAGAGDGSTMGVPSMIMSNLH